jgi:[ribosomal protein S18]-alanine N-acetyltransferase
MSALPSVMPSAWDSLQPLEARFEPMRIGALDAVMAVERAAYPWPWNEGNMNDSIAQGHDCQQLVDGQALLGYYVAMRGVDEVHLLNITVAPRYRQQGWARVMLDDLADASRARGAQWLWLEVRVSNARAIEVYERYGFRRINLRKAYYPLDGLTREDALVMNFSLT